MPTPGEHRIVPWAAALQARAEGWTFRDTLLVLGPDGLQAWLLVRWPLNGTVIDTALKDGQGCLNIDACRVQHANQADLGHHRDMVARIKERGGSMANSWKNSSDLSGASDVSTAGRWPPNVLLVHGPGCRMAGVQTGIEWTCQPGCLVAALDGQSGDVPGMSSGGAHAQDYPGGLFGGIDSTHTARGDAGGASRFFPQLADLAAATAWCTRLVHPV